MTIEKRSGSLPAFRFRSLDAAQRAALAAWCAADPGSIYPATTWVPALRSGASAPHRVRDTRDTSVRSALRRRGRPRLDQRVVVDGFALWLLVRQLALGRDVAVLCRLREPILGRFLLVELRSALALDAGFLEAFHHRILRGCQRVHRRLRRLRTGRCISDVLPPQLRKLGIIRHVVAGRGPLHARRRTVELD